MTDGNPYFSWPGAKTDDRIIVEEMLRDPLSGQWYECNEFVKMCVQKQAQNIPQDQREDIVQDVMERIRKSLPAFEYRSSLRTWIFGIVRNCIIDVFRRGKHEKQLIVPPDDPRDDNEGESSKLTAHISKTIEEICIDHESLEEALAALQEYVSTHAKSERNKRILDLVVNEGLSLEEVAKAVGCSAPVVGYFMRSIRRFIRGRLKDEQ